MEFINAQELAKRYTDTFEVPSIEQLNKLRIDNYVKICNGKERFWVKLTNINDDNLTGIVVSYLVFDATYNLGSMIHFTKNSFGP